MGPKWDPQTDNFGGKSRFSGKSKNLQKHCTVVDFWWFGLSKNVIYSMLKPLKKTIAKKVRQKITKNQMQIQKNPSKPPTY